MIEFIFQIINTLLYVMIFYFLFFFLPKKIKIKSKQIDNIEKILKSIKTNK
ncbi:hypothetical protein [Tepidibacter thalassicus]|uniref:Uncharacterized protein n=1 Tax=Tepidibacter thalassicus DSM 15285 TaxID=1123350 RepID=A0A1M5SWR0_9FIRM|nr:hypothetical protein [Tepidibacter thalassicus]SHH42939.1 hypothetical protein SAMN02744040_01942 [Tepidibacter thalassicus DSM 15285]